jgi:hypothetical protein
VVILKVGIWIVSLVFSLFLICGVIMGSETALEVYEIDTFTSCGKLGQLEGWVSADDKVNDFYKIAKEENNYFLKAKVKGDGAIIAKGFNYNLKEFPILSWRWRALKLPKGGDERYKNSGDSGAGVYIIFPSLIKPETLKNSWGIKIPVPDSLKPESIKYVWSSSLPKGTLTESPYSRKTKIIVLQNRSTPLNQWVAEEVNVYEDYVRVFHKEPDEVRAIGILTDADDTSSEAMADYDDIFIKKSAAQQTNVSEEKRVQLKEKL